MRKTILVLAGFALLSGCKGENSADDGATQAKDVAMVERMSKEPFQPIIPAAITSDDVARYGLDKPGCTFRKGESKDALFVAGKDEGFMRIGPDLKRYSAKEASADLSGGARSSYVGLGSWVDFVRLPDGDTGGGETKWPARLIVHDAQERVAFRADGMMTCTS